MAELVALVAALDVACVVASVAVIVVVFVDVMVVVLFVALPAVGRQLELAALLAVLRAKAVRAAELSLSIVGCRQKYSWPVDHSAGDLAVAVCHRC